MSTEQGGAVQAPNNDPLSAYTSAGYGVKVPSDYANADPAHRVAVSREVIGVLQQVFRGDYPLTEEYAGAMAEGLGNGDVHLFTVHEGGGDGPITATAAIVTHHNYTTGQLQSGELGRAGKLPDMAVPAKPLLRYRAAWAAKHLPELSFLYSSLRSSREARLDIPSGQAIQSVWLGADRGALMPTQGGFDYQAGGGIEPFTRIALPMRPKEWGAAALKSVVYVASHQDRKSLRTLVGEGTHGAVSAQVQVRTKGGDSDVPYYEVTPPNDKTHARYVVTRNIAADYPALDGDQVQKQVTEGISHKVVIESDISTTPDGAAVMARLRAQGWSFVGWQESEQDYGAICPVMARVNPQRIGELVMPGHGERQFDPGTRAVFNRMYADLLRNAALHSQARIIIT